jgi:hypothetical protein
MDVDWIHLARNIIQWWAVKALIVKGEKVLNLQNNNLCFQYGPC